MALAAGKLRHRVDLQEQVTTQDGYGSGNRTWSKFKTVWAEVRYANGNEKEQAQQTIGVVTHKVKIRYNSRIADNNVNTRIVFNGRILEVISVDDPSERNEMMFLTCKEVQ